MTNSNITGKFLFPQQCQGNRIILFTYFFFFWQFVLVGQSHIVGKLLDENSDQAIEGAFVADMTSNIFSYSNENGEFSLKTTCDSIWISALGYHDIVVSCDRPGDLVIKLSPLSFLFDKSIHILESRNLRIPGSYHKLDHSTLNLENPTNLANSLNTVPGVFMHSGTLNTNRITIRGIGNRSLFSTSKIKAYLADIPLTSGIGESTIEDIDLNLIDHIDIFKGPTASRYGAGLGGLIHLHPYISAFRTETTLKVLGGTGSYGQENFGSYLTLSNKNQGIATVLGYNFLQSDGYRENNEYTRHNFSNIFQLNKKNHQINLITNYIKLKAFIPSSLAFEDYDLNPQKANNNWANVMGNEDYNKLLIGFSHRYRLSEDWHLNSGLYINKRSSEEIRPFNILSDNSLVKGGRIRIEYEPSGISKQQFKLGLDWQDEDLDWQTYESLNGGKKGINLSMNHEDRRLINLFFEHSILLSKQWKFETGINLNTTSYRIEDKLQTTIPITSSEYRFDHVISPKFGLSYNPGVKQNFYLIVSHGFSAPTLEETLNPEGKINPEIKPETGWNMELGMRSVLFDDRLSIEASLYRMLIRNLLVARRVDFDQYIGLNAGKTKHDGFEMLINTTIVSTKSFRLNLINGYQYSHYRFEDFIDQEKDHTGNQLTGTSPHLLNSILQINWKPFFSTLHFRYVDKMPLRDDNSLFSSPHHFFNFKIGYRGKNRKNNQWEYSFGINNLTNKKYPSMYLINASSFGGRPPRYYYPAMPCNFYIRINYQFSL